MSVRVDIAVGELLKKDAKMIRFWGARMVIELTLGRMLTGKEQRKLYNKCRIDILKAVA